MNRKTAVGISKVSRLILVVAIDVFAALAAVVGAYAFTPERGRFSWMQLFFLGSVTAACFVGANAVARGYQVMWRYFNLLDAVRLVAAGTIAGVALLLLSLTLPVGDLSPVSVFVSPLLTIAIAGSARAIRRLGNTDVRGLTHRNGRPARSARDAHRLLIAGAGFTGEQVTRDLRRWRDADIQLVGFLDDDPEKLGRQVNGVPVIGQLSDLGQASEALGITGLLVAMPTAPQDMLRRLTRKAEDLGLRVYSQTGIAGMVYGNHQPRPGSVTLDEILSEAALSQEQKRSTERSARRILITGGAGYIGSHLTRMMLEAGYEVRILESFLYGREGLKGIVGHDRLEVIEGDICSVRDVHRAVKGVDAVIALAALVGDPACSVDPQETINLNYESTKILIEAASFHGVRRVVFASSCSVYGASTGDQLLTERSKLNAVSLYARTRILSENILFDRQGSVEVVVLRLATVFGLSPRMRFDLVVNTLTARAVTEGSVTVFGGDQWRPNVHCRDAARAFKLAAEAPADLVAGEVFNVGGEENNHQIADLARIVAANVGNVVIHEDRDSPDRRDYKVSFGKIRERLGFVPEYSVRDGVREIAEAIQSKRELREYSNPLFSNVRTVELMFAIGDDH